MRVHVTRLACPESVATSGVGVGGDDRLWLGRRDFAGLDVHGFAHPHPHTGSLFIGHGAMFGLFARGIGTALIGIITTSTAALAWRVVDFECGGNHRINQRLIVRTQTPASLVTLLSYKTFMLCWH